MSRGARPVAGSRILIFLWQRNGTPLGPVSLFAFPAEPAIKIAASLLFAVALGTPAAADDLASVALNSLTAAPARLSAAPVLDQNGVVIGKVRAVVTDQDGRPAALSYVAGNRLLIIAAPAVSYDEQKNLVVADTSQATLDEQMAAK